MPSAEAIAAATQMYRDILGREPDAGGLEAFAGAIDGGSDIGSLAQSMAGSQEAQNNANSGQGPSQQQQQAAIEQAATNPGGYVQQATNANATADYVRALYQSVLGRAPDAQGLQDNINAIMSGRITPEGLAASFAGSPEAQSNNIPAAQEQAAAQAMSGTWGQPGSTSINTATGDWSGVTPAQLVNAGITNQAILTAAANGTLNDNIFGAYKVDANAVANALNNRQAVPTDTAQQLNSQTNNGYSPNGQVTNIRDIGGGKSVYYYSDGATATINANGTVDHVTPPASVYRQQEGSIARTDNPGYTYFNGQIVKVETPALNWDPSKNQVAQTNTGQVTTYDPGNQSGGIGGALANFDKGVRDTIPGGWYTVGAVALAVATYGASSGLTATSTAAAATDAAGMAAAGQSASTIAGTLATEYGVSAATAEAMAAAATTTSAASAGSTALGTSILGQMGLSPAVTNALITIGQGSLTGAGMGGITAAITGGDIGKAILSGAISGGVTGGVGSTLASLGPITSGAIAGAAGGATNAALNGGSIATGAITGGVSGGMNNYLSGTQYAEYAKIGAGASGGIVSSLLNGTNLAYGAVSGAALGGIGGLVASGVTAITNPLVQSSILGSHVNANGTTTFTADDGSTWTQDASGKLVGQIDPRTGETVYSTPAFETMSFDDGSTITYNPFTGEVVSATDWDGNVHKAQDVPQWLLDEYGFKPDVAGLTAGTMSGVLAPKVSSALQKLISGQAPVLPPVEQTYGPIGPVTFGSGQQLNFGGMNQSFLNPVNFGGWGRQTGQPGLDVNEFTRNYMKQPGQAEWSQGANKQTAQYVPVPFQPKTAADYTPQQIFGPSGQPGAPIAPYIAPNAQPNLMPTPTPFNAVSGVPTNTVAAVVPDPYAPTQPVVPTA